MVCLCLFLTYGRLTDRVEVLVDAVQALRDTERLYKIYVVECVIEGWQVKME